MLLFRLMFKKLPDAFPLPAGQDTGRQGGFVPIDHSQRGFMYWFILMETMWCLNCTHFFTHVAKKVTKGMSYLIWPFGTFLFLLLLE